MAMSSNSCDHFLDVLASKAPTPGGGGAAAMGGAIGMALSNMVGNLTVGKKKYAEVEDEVKKLLEEGYEIIDRLKKMVDEDAEAFAPLAKAYGLPRSTEEEKAHKAKTLEECSKVALSVPLEIMRQSFRGIKIHQRMGQIGSMLAISDVGCGVALLKSALQSAHLNVLINLGAIKDQPFVENVTREMDRLLEEGGKIADETLELVIGKIK